MTESTHGTGGKDRAQSALFPPTSWTMIREATDRTSRQWRDRLGSLLTLYWKPVYVWIRAHWHKSGDEAEDLTQGFFTLLLEGEYLANVAPEHGAFRSYLKTSLHHFLVDRRRRAQASKREGSHERIPMDVASAEGLLIDPASESPDAQFDRAWIATCVEEAVQILEQTLKTEGKEKYFEVFRSYYVDPMKSSDGASTPPTHAELAERLGLGPHDAGNYLVYTRRKLREILRDCARDITSSDAEAEAELRFVMQE